MKRILLFMATNIAIMVTLMFVLSLLGVTGYLTADGLDYGALMVFSLVWGFGGAFISLLMSRWMAKTAMGVQLVNGRSGHAELDWLYQSIEQLTRTTPFPSGYAYLSALVVNSLTMRAMDMARSLATHIVSPVYSMVISEPVTVAARSLHRLDR